MGCSHYSRGCEIFAPCCQDWYACRHCHNQVRDREEEGARRHILDRCAVKLVRCNECDTEQPPAQNCQACGHTFGQYTCLVCNYFDNDVSKRQFHCAQCGICRVGGRENFFHCNECGCCYERRVQENHQCVTNNLQQPCPLCGEVLFDSTAPLTVLECGHAMHRECSVDLLAAGMPACPLCLRTAADRAKTQQVVEEAMTALAAAQTDQHNAACDGAAVPSSDDVRARGKAQGLQRFCVFCRQQTEVEQHTLGVKCANCGSFCD